MKAIFRGGPSDGEDREVDDAIPSIIGSPSQGGIYERTGEKEADGPVYRWRDLTADQAEALTRDLERASGG
jgi:hypothetical protein